MHSFDITDPDTYIEMEAWERLRSIIDPELHVNIIDLGLVYTIRANSTVRMLVVVMTLSSPSCPVGEAILQGVANCLQARFVDYKIDVQLTWEPAWGFDNITEEGKKQLWG